MFNICGGETFIAELSTTTSWYHFSRSMTCDRVALVHQQRRWVCVRKFVKKKRELARISWWKRVEKQTETSGAARKLRVIYIKKMSFLQLPFIHSAIKRFSGKVASCLDCTHFVRLWLRYWLQLANNPLFYDFLFTWVFSIFSHSFCLLLTNRQHNTG